ncbi:MAG: DUF421 domain-containing protein [Faecousia sp.]
MVYRYCGKFVTPQRADVGIGPYNGLVFAPKMHNPFFWDNTIPKGSGFVILTYCRTVILYLILILVIRLMGKRQIGQLEPAEFVVTMLVANLAAIPMQDGGIPLFSGLVPILTVLGLELILSVFAVKNMTVRRLLCGKPVILIQNGKILQKNMEKTRISLDELTGHLREKDVLDPSQVQYAILETNGNLSVFPYPKYRPASAMDAGIQAQRQYLPVTIISDGCLLSDNLQLAKKDLAWVQRVLKDKNASVDKTWLLTVDESDRILWYPKEGSL